MYPESVSSIFRITDDIYSAATGLSGDVRYQVNTGLVYIVHISCKYLLCAPHP